jgi:hypothetical protein
MLKYWVGVPSILFWPSIGPHLGDAYRFAMAFDLGFSRQRRRYGYSVGLNKLSA